MPCPGDRCQLRAANEVLIIQLSCIWGGRSVEECVLIMPARRDDWEGEVTDGTGDRDDPVQSAQVGGEGLVVLFGFKDELGKALCRMWRRGGEVGA